MSDFHAPDHLVVAIRAVFFTISPLTFYAVVEHDHMPQKVKHSACI
jgi:hypothetical protein